MALRQFGVAALAGAVLVGCGDDTLELSSGSEQIAWSYKSHAPYWAPGAKVRVESLKAFTVDGRIFVIEWSKKRPSVDRIARILRIDGAGKTRQAEQVGAPILFSSSTLNGIFPVQGGSGDRRRLLIARSIRDPDSRLFKQRLSLVTVSGDGTISKATDAVTIPSLALVRAAWRMVDGGILVVGADSDGKYRTMRVVTLDRSGRPGWHYLASDLPGKQSRLGTATPAAVDIAPTGITLYGSDARWSGNAATRYVHRLSLDAEGKRTDFRSLFDVPKSDMSSGSVKGLAVSVRPILSHLSRAADGSFVGLFNGWYKGERRALRAIKLTPDGKIVWLRELLSEERNADRHALGIAPDGEALAFGIVGEKRRLFRIAPDGTVLSRYTTPTLQVLSIQAHSKRGYLLVAIQTNKDNTNSLALLHYRPGKAAR